MLPSGAFAGLPVWCESDDTNHSSTITRPRLFKSLKVL
jgi:hypothetical protein